MKMKVAHNAYENGGSKCLWNGGFEHLYKWWLWRPMQMVALNTYEMMALNAYANDGGS